MHDAEYLVPGNNRVPRQLQLPGGGTGGHVIEKLKLRAPLVSVY